MSSAAAGDSSAPIDRIHGRALLVWAVAVAVYIGAITARTSMGVAGVDAMERFSVDASRLAVFVGVQVGVYAAAQIPVGLLIDRYGPRKVLVVGAVIIAVGQTVLALTTSYPLAILGRVLIGAGDATAFLSVMRLLPAWFPIRVTPVFTQLTSSLGQIGQFLSAVPFLAALHHYGWLPAFLGLGTAGLLVALAAGVAVVDSPEAKDKTVAVAPATAHTSTPPTPSWVRLKERLAYVVKQPVCWQAFFTHWSGLGYQATFTLLWGMPLMTLGMGLTPAQASTVLIVNTVSIIIGGPLVGLASARFDRSRVALALVCSTLTTLALVWLLYLAGDNAGASPSFAVIAVVNVILGAASQAANVGFDDVRVHVERHALATATGLANMGGFVATMLAAQLIGFGLDWSNPARDYGWADFQFAYLAAFLVWGVGVVGLVVARRAVR